MGPHLLVSRGVLRSANSLGLRHWRVVCPWRRRNFAATGDASRSTVGPDRRRGLTSAPAARACAPTNPRGARQQTRHAPRAPQNSQPQNRDDQMPLVRIDLVEGRPVEYGRGIGDVIYHAMVDVLKVPKDDRFQVITEHPERSLIATRTTSESNAPRTAWSSRSRSTQVGRSSRRNLFIERWRKNFIPAWDFALRTSSSASSRFPKRTGRSGTATRNTLICEFLE